MAIVYTWKFPQFDVIPSEDGMTDVVKIIHWRMAAVDGGYSAEAYGTVTLTAPDPDAFIPYDQITEQWAIDACSSELKVPELQAALAANIEEQKNPPIVPMAPPFAQ